MTFWTCKRCWNMVRCNWTSRPANLRQTDPISAIYLVEIGLLSRSGTQFRTSLAHARMKEEVMVNPPMQAAWTQVFINILSNARKYCTSDMPEVHIQVRSVQDVIEIDFTDNGSGIPTESQAPDLREIRRLTDSLHAGGAGLGLAICREIMQNPGR